MSLGIRLRGLMARGPRQWREALERRLHGALARGHERWRDWRDGVETMGHVNAADIVTDSANKARGIRYQPSPLVPLRALLHSLDLPPGKVFVDIGAGKGRVLLIARELPFSQVIGIEYSEPLCAVARANVASAQRRLPDGAPVEIHCLDAADYGFEHDEEVIYLFNPFDEVMMARVLQNLHASLLRFPRRAWLLYHFPRWHAAVAATGWLRLQAVHRDGEHEFAIFVHEPAAHLKGADHAQPRREQGAAA